MSTKDQDNLQLQYQSLVGSLNWLSHTTWLDLSTIVSLLAQHQNNPSQGHLGAAHYVVKYLSYTKTLGIYFSSSRQTQLESFFTFPCSFTVGINVRCKLGPSGCFSSYFSS
jgi:hypothetical protein